MNKPTLVMAAPIDTVSGYGVHSRLIAKSLLQYNQYDVKFLSMPWGNTPIGALDPEADKDIVDKIIPDGRLTFKPDIWIQCTIPSEMQRVGERNILITAATEADVMPEPFVHGCNRADLIIAPSNFTAKVIQNTVLEKVDQRTKQVVEQSKVTVPVEVLFEGIDTSVFNKNNIVETDLVDRLNNIPEKFCFLYTGHWLQGQLFCDRKDTGGLIHTFLKTFMRKGSKNRPALILKTSGAGFSLVERDQVIDKIWQIKELIREQDGFEGKFPSIYLINGELTDSEMNVLYRHPKVKTMITLTKAEGFGLPLAEFATTGKPIVAPNYSGYLDFIQPDHHALLPVQLAKIHPSAANEWIPRDANWSQVNYTFVGQVMQNIMDHYPKYLEKSRKSPKFMQDNFSLTKMTEKFLEILQKHCTLPEKKAIKLPELAKAVDGKPKIELPKLVKMT